MYSRDAKGSIVKYSLPKFAPLKITAVNLAPRSQDVSVRLNLETDSGYPGFLDINYTAINRKPPYNGLERYLFLINPKKLFNIIDTNWELIKKGKTSLGMNQQEVMLSLGNPIDKFNQGSEMILVYPSSKLITQHFIFFKDHLVEIKSTSGDTFLNRNQSYTKKRHFYTDFEKSERRERKINKIRKSDTCSVRELALDHVAGFFDEKVIQMPNDRNLDGYLKFTIIGPEFVGLY